MYPVVWDCPRIYVSVEISNSGTIVFSRTTFEGRRLLAMKDILKPSIRWTFGFILLMGMWTAPRTEAQPPPLPAPDMGFPPPIVVSRYPVAPPPSLQQVRDDYDFTPIRFGFNHRYLDNDIDDPFTDFRFFVPSSDDEKILFLDGRMVFGNDLSVSGLGYNFGVGARSFSERLNAVRGINVFADRRQTALERYHQVGFGLELLGEKWEMRSNAYFPYGVDRTVTSSQVALRPGTSPQFRDQFISVETLGTFQTFEQALKGFDLEIGRRFTRLTENNEDWLIRGYLGGYYYDNTDLRDFPGISGRISANYRDALETNITVQNDRYFGTQAGFSLTLYVDPLIYRNQDYHAHTQDVRNHMARPVERKQLITIVRDSAIIGPPVPLDLTSPTTNSPLTVTHIDSNDAGSNAGTFENPFQTLADAAGSTTDLVYVHSASSFDGEGYALAPNQRFLGEGDNVAFTIDTNEFGTIALPVGNDLSLARPVINNSPVNAITLASNTQVSNFDITNATQSSLFGDGANNSVVEFVTASNSGGPAISLNDSTVAIYDSMFSTMTADAHGAFISGSSNVLMDNVQLMTMADDAVGLRAQDTSIVRFFNSQIGTDGLDAYGVYLLGSSDFTIDNSDITTLQARSTGLRAEDLSSADILNGTIISTMGLGGVGVAAADNSLVSIVSSRVTTQGDESQGVFGVQSISAGSVITTNGLNSYAVAAGIRPTEIYNSIIRTFGAGANAVQVDAPNGGSVLTLANSLVDADQALEIYALNSSLNQDLELEIYGNFLQGSSGEVLFGTGIGTTLTIFGPSYNSQADFIVDNGIAGGTINTFGSVFFSALP